MAALVAKLLPLGLMLMMLVVGLRLELRGLKGVLSRPRALVVGLAVQVLALPILAYLIGAGLGLSGAFLIGVVLTAAAPGGVTSNYVAYWAKADLGLSVALTLITTALASLTLPAVLAITGQGVLPDVWALARICGAMGIVTLLPMIIGSLVRHFRPALAEQAISWLDPIARVVFIAMVLATFFQNRGVLLEYAYRIAPAMVLLNISALLTAAVAATLARLSRPQGRAIMVEASLQNVAVVLFVAGTLLGDPTLSVPGLIYAIVMNLSALLQVGIGHLYKTPARIPEPN